MIFQIPNRSHSGIVFDKCRKSRSSVSGYINSFPNRPWFFMCLQNKPFENTAGEREITRNEQFLLFPQRFLPVWRTFFHFHQSWNCCLQMLSVWKNLKFVVRERVKCGRDKVWPLNNKNTLKCLSNYKPPSPNSSVGSEQYLRTGGRHQDQNIDKFQGK